MTGRQIRKLRERLGLTQQRFASLLGFSFVSVNRWENGHSAPTGLSAAVLELLTTAMAHSPETDLANVLRQVKPEPLEIIRTLVRLGDEPEQNDLPPVPCEDAADTVPRRPTT